MISGRQFTRPQYTGHRIIRFEGNAGVLLQAATEAKTIGSYAGVVILFSV